MRIVVDLDGVLVEQRDDMQYQHAKPKTDLHHRMIEWVRAKHRAGHEIVIDTARGSGTGKDWRDVTEDQLERYEIPYSFLRVGQKAHGDLYVDDRAERPEDVLGEAV